MPDLLKHIRSDGKKSLSLIDKIKIDGHKGECIRIKTSDGPVYICLDHAFRRWCQRSTGEARVCFTVSELSMLIGSYPDIVPLETYNEVVRPLIYMKRALPRSTIMEVRECPDTDTARNATPRTGG